MIDAEVVFLPAQNASASFVRVALDRFMADVLRVREVAAVVGTASAAAVVHGNGNQSPSRHPSQTQKPYHAAQSARRAHLLRYHRGAGWT